MLKSGLTQREVARRMAIPRSTIQRWHRHDRSTVGDARRAVDSIDLRHGRSYAYLLGTYLGDGHISRTSQRSWRLGIYCDRRYPGIVEEVRDAIKACAPESVPRVNRKGSGGLVVLASSDVWPVAFPQHGPGAKHQRKIDLEPWQEAIARKNPEALLRGLIHSDGCRCVNAFTTELPSGGVASYSYPRYFFSNLSSDIRSIFCDACDQLEIKWTRSNSRNISISHGKSVAVLDSFVGAKH